MNRSRFPSLALIILSACQAPSSNRKSTNAEWKVPSTEAPLGRANLRQTISSNRLALGVSYYQILRGNIDDSAVWTVNLGFYASRFEAQAALKRLSHFGISARIDPSAGAKPDGSTLGYWLSVGKFPSRTAALDAAKQIEHATAGNENPTARNTALAGYPTSGPWIVNILAIQQPQTTAKLVVEAAGDRNLGAHGETVSAAAARLGALAGTNGGFFTDVNPLHAELPPRSPVGTTIVDGKMIATAIGGRPGILIEKTADGRPKVTILRNLTTRVTVSDARHDTIAVMSIDRPILGTVVNCGAPAGSPAKAPAHDSVCTNSNDLVLYDSFYLRGKASNALVAPHNQQPTYEVLADVDNTVVDGHSSLGAPPPAGGVVLQGLGKSASWLRAHAHRGTKLLVKKQFFADSKEIPLTEGISVIEGGPVLSDPELASAAAKEGFGPRSESLDVSDSAGTAHDDWYNGWWVARSARTALGIAKDGTILLVEIDGRQPDLSLGVSIPELAATMKWLGAVTAINLDGGGSSNMVVQGTSVGHPSDTIGERGVGDTLMILTR